VRFREIQFRDVVPPGRNGPPRALRALGFASMAAVLGTPFVTDPKPGLHGDGPVVALAILLMASGLVLAMKRVEWFPAARFLGLCVMGVATLLFGIFQPDSAGYAGVYFVVVLGGMRLEREAAALVCGGTVLGLLIVAIEEKTDAGTIIGLVFSVAPWFLIMRLIRQLAIRQNEALELVEELRESREAEAESAKLNERGRVARELHDVLAHSLSALSLQLEGTRLLARKHGSHPSVIEGLDRAHHLATSGLTEARQAISALRGEELPALEDLARNFPGANVTILGTPREPSSEAKLALYRTAQEALTNIRRHSASDRVELKLDYTQDGTTLTVQDHGKEAPKMNGTPGYGLTGMRERAELLGGRLNAGPTNDGFRVELWLPS
jgi:signal transduction histidine kinase